MQVIGGPPVRSSVTVLFQQLVRYNASAAENISLGDLTSVRDRPRIEDAATAAGASEVISCLPNGYEQMLGRWFEHGTELSTGEWQRLALARAFLRRSPLVVLDEPTSAMGPWSEAEDWNVFGGS